MTKAFKVEIEIDKNKCFLTQALIRALLKSDAGNIIWPSTVEDKVSGGQGLGRTRSRGLRFQRSGTWCRHAVAAVVLCNAAVDACHLSALSDSRGFGACGKQQSQTGACEDLVHDLRSCATRAHASWLCGTCYSVCSVRRWRLVIW